LGGRGLLQQTADGRFVRPVILNARHGFFFSFGGAALRQDVDVSRKRKSYIHCIRH
jgi:hypothetical protein